MNKTLCSDMNNILHILNNLLHICLDINNILQLLKVTDRHVVIHKYILE